MISKPEVTATLPEGPVSGAVRVEFFRAGQLYASTGGYGAPESIMYRGRPYYVGITFDLVDGVWDARQGESVRRDSTKYGTEDVQAPTVRAAIIDAVKAATVAVWTPELDAVADYVDAVHAVESLTKRREDLTRQLEVVCAELAPYVIVINRGDPRKSIKD